MHEALESYISKWGLSDPQPLAQTFTSELYKVQAANGFAVLKILSKVGVEARKWPPRSGWYDGQGAIQLLKHDEGAMLLEYADGGDLSALVKDGKDDAATQIIVDVLKKLHRENQDNLPQGLTTVHRRFAPYFGRPSKILRRGHHPSFFARCSCPQSSC